MSGQGRSSAPPGCRAERGSSKGIWNQVGHAHLVGIGERQGQNGPAGGGIPPQGFTSRRCTGRLLNGYKQFVPVHQSAAAFRGVPADRGAARDRKPARPAAAPESGRSLRLRKASAIVWVAGLQESKAGWRECSPPRPASTVMPPSLETAPAWDRRWADPQRPGIQSHAPSRDRPFEPVS